MGADWRGGPVRFWADPRQSAFIRGVFARWARRTRSALSSVMSVSAAAGRVHRVEVRVREGVDDARAGALVQQAAGVGVPVRRARTARVYLIEGAMEPAQRRLGGERLLADPVTEEVQEGASEPGAGAVIIEVHPLP